MPMRPTLLRSPWPAMPVTSVASIKGATMVLINRRKMSLKTRRLIASAGASKPSSAPATIATKIHGVRDRRRSAKIASSRIAAQRRMIPTLCNSLPWERPSVIPSDSKITAVGNNIRSKFVFNIRCEEYQPSIETRLTDNWFSALIAYSLCLATSCTFFCFVRLQHIR